MFRELLASEFALYGRLSTVQLDQLEQHYDLLVRWNKRINLTRIIVLEDVVRLHYCESLFLAKALPPTPLRIVDVGSGAGFPGIPVAVLRPDCSIDLVESHQRKAVFLREASRSFSNVRVVPQRAETLDPRYDWVIARAVRPADVVASGLAANMALLLGDEDAGGFSANVKSIPWGINRKLVMFHVEHDKI